MNIATFKFIVEEKTILDGTAKELLSHRPL